MGDVAVMQLSGGRTFVRGSGMQLLTIHRRRLMKPVVEGSADAVAPSAGWTRLHWFLDTKFDVLDNNPTLVATHGRSTIGTIAPHGIIGQSFDGSMIAVSGKLDDYGDRPEFTTSAQAEGAIEGTAADYIDAFALLDGLSLLALQRQQPSHRAMWSLLAGAEPPPSRLSRQVRYSFTAWRRREGTTPAPASFFGRRLGGVHVPATTAGAAAAAAADAGNREPGKRGPLSLREHRRKIKLSSPGVRLRCAPSGSASLPTGCQWILAQLGSGCHNHQSKGCVIELQFRHQVQRLRRHRRHGATCRQHVGAGRHERVYEPDWGRSPRSPVRNSKYQHTQ